MVTLRLTLIAAIAASAPIVAHAQSRDAAAVLSDMRQALGGSVLLDGITTLSIQGTSTRTIDGRGRPNDLEILAIVPDHYLEIRRDHGSPGPIDTRVTYYNGFRPGARIRRTDATIPFPELPGPNTPEAIAERERLATLHLRQEFARLALVLFGRAYDTYPLDFTYAGVAQEGGRSYEVLDARAPDGYLMRLAVDQQTHLPAVLSWVAEAEIITTTSSIVTTRNGEVVNSRDDPPPPMPSGPPSMTTRKLVLSDFKTENGVTWPRTLKESSPLTSEDMTFRRIRLNPKLETRRFDIR
jgi:hypothetical protein